MPVSVHCWVGGDGAGKDPANVTRDRNRLASWPCAAGNLRPDCSRIGIEEKVNDILAAPLGENIQDDVSRCWEGGLRIPGLG